MKSKKLLTFKTYEDDAAITDEFSGNRERSVQLSFHNLRREIELLFQFTRTESRDQIKQDKIGDILWYLNNISKHLSYSLEDIAKLNLTKISEMYPVSSTIIDTGLDIEQLPNNIEVNFLARSTNQISLLIKLDNDEYIQLGDTLTDNSYSEDYYRFHDVFHFSYMVHLNWSPVLRSLLKRKRKSNPKIDEVEDGARANIIEEAVTAVIFSRVKTQYGEIIPDQIDFETLDIAKQMTRDLEVRSNSYQEWEIAIKEGFRVFNQLVSKKYGTIVINRSSKKMEFVEFIKGSEIFNLQAKIIAQSASAADDRTKDALGEKEKPASDDVSG